jgi:predicted DNA-binding protein with PD1-like motif
MMVAMSSLATLPLRLYPGDDLRPALVAALAAAGQQAGFVVSGIGSLRPVVLRLAGAEQTLTLDEDAEVLTLAGSLGTGGAHLHASVSLADGRVLGGHVAPGCIVRTTAEVLVVALPAWHFDREPDPSTGYQELVVRPRGRDDG